SSRQRHYPDRNLPGGESTRRDRGGGGDRQRNQARQSRGGGLFEPKALLRLAAGSAEGIFSARPAQPRGQRHARKDDDDRLAHLDPDGGGAGARLYERRAAAQSRAGRAL